MNTKESAELSTDYVVLSLGVESVYEVEEVCKEISDKVIIVGNAQKVGRIQSLVGCTLFLCIKFKFMFFNLKTPS